MAVRTELVQVEPLEGQEPQPRRGCLVVGVEGTVKVDSRDSGGDIVIRMCMRGRRREFAGISYRTQLGVKSMSSSATCSGVMLLGETKREGRSGLLTPISTASTKLVLTF